MTASAQNDHINIICAETVICSLKGKYWHVPVSAALYSAGTTRERFREKLIGISCWSHIPLHAHLLSPYPWNIFVAQGCFIALLRWALYFDLLPYSMLQCMVLSSFEAGKQQNDISELLKVHTIKFCFCFCIELDTCITKESTTSQKQRNHHSYKLK